jgi:hypothetical protein
MRRSYLASWQGVQRGSDIFIPGLPRFNIEEVYGQEIGISLPSIGIDTKPSSLIETDRTIFITGQANVINFGAVSL